MNPAPNISGLILSAGASSRMGTPKALLKLNSGNTLLTEQVATLVAGGCREIFVVVGADAETIKSGHPKLSVSWVENKNWKLGQFSSLQAGLSTILKTDAEGIILLPIDTIGIKSATVAALIETALRNPHLKAIIPEYEGRRGHPIYLSNKIFKSLIDADPFGEDARLDIQLKKYADVICLPVKNPQILQNINTPDEWRAYCRKNP